ncbi:MAG TPA: hypothetical protein H9943_02560 [Candidatus Ruthenibacterium avium]|uniref:DUF4064 domain-containing protein n=1 Tax=Candidatus Ruthenibacterium avium TaxID=2838751 RepID=A0A9D2S1J2_9FIRM|nr:hypothetical protein [Candidatus Ruthenibacterium avium]
MKEKNKFLQIGSILMIVAAVVFIISVAVGMPQVIASLDFLKTTNLDGTQMMENAEKLNMTADQAIAFSSTIIYVLIGIMVAFNVVKIIVGILGLKKADQPSKFFTVWGVIFLIFGILGLGNIVSIMDLCNLAGGIAAPILFLIGAKQNKKNSV